MTRKTDPTQGDPIEDISVAETIVLCISLGTLVSVCVSVFLVLAP